MSSDDETVCGEGLKMIKKLNFRKRRTFKGKIVLLE